MVRKVRGAPLSCAATEINTMERSLSVNWISRFTGGKLEKQVYPFPTNREEFHEKHWIGRFLFSLARKHFFDLFRNG
jgi:hypothetical protein